MYIVLIFKKTIKITKMEKEKSKKINYNKIILNFIYIFFTLYS